ncbi:hypothetical protein JOS77_02985 [Chromobacterium haemolyticum]|nr:hypothetical protein JOS77_02985 [Chromobacterium haemolyticum]
MKSIWKLLGIVLLSGCAALPQETDPPGRIVDLRSGEALQPAQLLQRLAPAPRLLVGGKSTITPSTTASSAGWRRNWRRAGRKAACCWKC